MTATARPVAELDPLEVLDAELEACGLVRSLGPGRPRARALADLAGALLADETRPAIWHALATGLCRLVEAVRAAFPDNIFWDFDYLAASLLAHARTRADPVAALDGSIDAIIDLQQQFGHRTVIHFRYVHDFLYGFDWAKWVRKSPTARASVGPFDPRFVDVMRRRGEELMELIASGTERKYPPLPSGHHRNPFGFSRAPQAELTLLRHLARNGLVPVEAWRIDAIPRWDRDYAELRRQEAMKLGLAGDDRSARR